MAISGGNVGIGTTGPGAKLDVNGSILLSSAISTITHQKRTLQSGGFTLGTTYYVKLYDTTSTEAKRLSFQLQSYSSSEYAADVDIFIPAYVFHTTGYGGATSGVGPQVTTRMGGLTAQSVTFKKIHVASTFNGTAASDVQIWLEFFASTAERIVKIMEQPGSEPITWTGLTTVAPTNIQYSVDFVQGAKNENRIVSRIDGNVGIGTTAPNGKLAVVAGADTWAGNFFGLSSSNQVRLGTYAGVATIGANNNTGTAWANLAINPGGGNVGIGTTSPGAKLEVVGDFIRTVARWAGVGVDDGQDNGALVGRTITFTKKASNTGIRVAWNDNFRVLGTATACRWEIVFNGASCSNPGVIGFDKYEGGTGSNRLDPNSVFGTCFGLAAGTVTISTKVGPAPGYGVTDCYTGWQSGTAVVTLEAEEVR